MLVLMLMFAVAVALVAVSQVAVAVTDRDLDILAAYVKLKPNAFFFALLRSLSSVPVLYLACLHFAIGLAGAGSQTRPIRPSLIGSPSHYGPIWKAARSVPIIISALA